MLWDGWFHSAFIGYNFSFINMMFLDVLVILIFRNNFLFQEIDYIF